MLAVWGDRSKDRPLQRTRRRYRSRWFAFNRVSHRQYFSGGIDERYTKEILSGCGSVQCGHFRFGRATPCANSSTAARARCPTGSRLATRAWLCRDEPTGNYTRRTRLALRDGRRGESLQADVGGGETEDRSVQDD